MPLEIAYGHATLTGPRRENEDFCGLITPAGPELDVKGVLAAVADGVAGEGGGRQASEYAVRSLLTDYYATPDTWGVPLALDRVLNAVNRWLIAQGTAHRNTVSLATTLSAIVLRGRRYVIAHVGDSRIYRLRAGELTVLTQDHVWDHPDMRHVLARAIGLDAHLVMDYADGELEPGDVFLLATDGVWAPLGSRNIAAALAGEGDPQSAASALCQAGLAAGGQDNATALVLRVERVPEAGLADSLTAGRELPLPPLLRPGDVIDGFEVVELLHESRATRLYKVTLRDSGQPYVLKTLKPGREDEAPALVAEAWMARRVQSDCFPEVLPLATDRRSALYYVMSHHAGHTLERLLEAGRHFSISETAALGIRLMKGLGALHRLNIVHRDIKPANLLLCEDGRLRILDLGVALNAGMVHEAGAGNAGTPSFMAPELFSGAEASPVSDLYAAGVSLYHLLTRQYPYGEIEPFQHPRFGDPVPPTRYRPDVPGWLEAILLKAVARDPARRFETAEEMLLALERGAQQPLSVPRRTPLAERDALRVWLAVAVTSILVNLVLLYLLIV